MKRYLNLFKTLTDANLNGAKGLYEPQVNFVEGYSTINFKSKNEERFTCGFNEDGKMKDILPVGSAYTINKFVSQPFLGETYIEDYDFTEANRFLVNRFSELNNYSTKFTACSSCRNGSYAGRNLDWYIKDYAMLILHMPANGSKGRYASVGVCSSTPFITRGMISNGLVPDMLKIDGKIINRVRNNFPIFTTDGINEHGVCVNTNIVVHEDGAREGYIPCTGHSGESISFVSLPRYVLDNCKSCDDAIEKLSSLSVVQANKGPLSTEDSHIMVSDSGKTVIFEWYNNEFIYTEYKSEKNFKSSNGMPCIMTNFYNCKGEENTVSGVTDWDNLLISHPYAMGIERYNLLVDGLDSVNSIDSMKEQIEKVIYSKYFNKSSLWYTENPREGYFKENGQWKYYKDSALTETSIATDVKDAMVKCYETYQMEADENFGSLDKQMNILDKGGESEHWYTELTSIFDISEKCLYIMPQEGWYKKEYIKFSL